MIDSTLLLADLKRELKALEADLRERAEDQSSQWGMRLAEEYDAAKRRERTGLTWIDWRNGQVAQAAVTWIIATVFIRFSEDNELLTGVKQHGKNLALPWIASPGDGLERAVENEQAFYASSPTMTSRDWLQQAFAALAELPAGKPLVDPNHSAVWHAHISADAADRLLAFFRRTTTEGSLIHDFSDEHLDTRFLGDLYQDLSDYAKKTFALLQTPDFVEEFILDQTLTPAIAEFGLTGLKLIDPACGSGHFLLGAFQRILNAWAAAAPGIERGERVQRALDSIHGVDLNPFAIAIARFRLTVAAIQAAGISTLTAAPAFRYHLAIGDSLLGGVNTSLTLDLGDSEYFEYDTEDLREHADILKPGQYHVVVANPPYIQPPDPKLRDQYRALYKTCHGKYALSVPFMELLFRLAKRANGGGAGYVGQITANSFMKREFGKKLIEQFLSGQYSDIPPNYVELTHVIDTSGAYIPGHGTPTVILVGRPRKPQIDSVLAILGVRGEPSQPVEARNGFVWREIVDHLTEPGYDGSFVSISEVPRNKFSSFPWSLTGGGASELSGRIESSSASRLKDYIQEVGIVAVLGEESPFELPTNFHGPMTGLVLGDSVRDWRVESVSRFWPYDDRLEPSLEAGNSSWLWPYRTSLNNVVFFGKTASQRGLSWFQYAFLAKSKLQTPLSITFAFVATHNHFVLDRGGKVFNRSAPVIKLPADASEEDHFRLLGVLNSSTACFWLKQVSHDKRKDGEFWETFYEFTATKLEDFPLPQKLPPELPKLLDEVANERSLHLPSTILNSSGIRSLVESREEWQRLERQMVSFQEELDWQMYAAYGLCSDELAPPLPEIVPIQPNERVFEIQLARDLELGSTNTAWFDRHNRLPLTEFPEHWPDWYRQLATKRFEEIQKNPAIRILEQPEYKRRWAGASWEELLEAALKTSLLDRLEQRDLWCDSSNRPQVQTAAQLADKLRNDESFREMLALHAGSQDYDLTSEVSKLLALEAVPSFATLRYKDAGREKYRAWQKTWEHQRAGDRGERVDVPVPPKYVPGDFLKPTFWSLRGKLDVPKERFIAFPGSKTTDDATELYGWAGWDHAERGLAFGRLVNELVQQGATEDEIVPVLGSLIELEPWLYQWHDAVDARTGVSPASAVTQTINSMLTRLGIGRDSIENWQPPQVVRGRKSKT